MEDYKKIDVSQRKLEAKLEAEILYLSLFFKKKKKKDTWAEFVPQPSGVRFSCMCGLHMVQFSYSMLNFHPNTRALTPKTENSWLLILYLSYLWRFFPFAPFR